MLRGYHYFVLIIITFSWPATSQWYEAQGQAHIYNDNVQQAKSEATQNALKKALLVAGASVSSIQQVVNGLLTQNELSIRASGSVNSVELVNETYDGNLLTVTIRADIFPQERQCFSADYKKPLTITQSNLLYREQANVGQLYQVGTVLSNRLHQTMQSSNQFTDSRLTLEAKTEFSKIVDSRQPEQLKQLSMSIAEFSDTQFVLFSEIEDISLSQDGESSLMFWKEDVYERYFALSVYLYSGTNGEMIFQKRYTGQAPWEFNRRLEIDLNSRSFWDSAFGAMINNVLINVSNDTDEKLMCEPTRAKILQVEKDEITINLGSDNGVKTGDELTLMHLTNFVSDNGKLRTAYTISEHVVRVTQVSRQIAKAQTVNNKTLGNIQKNDLAVRH